VSTRAKGMLLGAVVLVLVWTAAVVAIATSSPNGTAAGSAASAGSPEATRMSPASGSAAERTAPLTPAEPTTTAAVSPSASDEPFGNPAPIPGEADDEARRVGRSEGGSEPRGPRRAPAPRPEGGAKRAPVGSAAGGEAGGGVELSGVERERAEAAAFNFVFYAYNYSGRNREQYESYVNQAVVPSRFEESPGAADVRAFAENVGAGGVESRLLSQSFELSPESAEKATVRATFTLRDPSGTRRLSQRLSVVALGPIWKVESAGPLQEAGS